MINYCLCCGRRPLLIQWTPAFIFNSNPAISCVSTRKISSITLPPKSTVLSGIQPTGVPHIGNYFGALHDWVKLQNGANPSTKLIFQIADLHAMTKPYDKQQLPRWKAQSLVALLAIGLDPQKCTIFFQSMVCLKSSQG